MREKLDEYAVNPKKLYKLAFINKLAEILKNVL